MAEASERIVVVGAGHAGGTLVGLLRQNGFAGEIVLVGDEPHLPYHRPPLSKQFMDGELEQLLRPAEFYVDQEIDTRLEYRVVGVDPQARTLELDSGEVLDWSALVLATGAAPRALPIDGADLPGIAALRTVRDARALRDVVGTGDGVVIAGAGYVGLEVAAVARSLDVPVTVLEREDRVLARVASPELSDIVSTFHAGLGTDIRTGATVAGIRGGECGIEAVLLDDGSTVPCTSLLVGIGAVPRDGLARAVGADCDGGVLVDHEGRTTVDGVFAIGDVTRRPLPGLDGLRRMESIPSAMEQAKQVAAAITGRPAPKPEVPWFWSDQLTMKLKIAGILDHRDDTVLRGDPATGSFALFHLRDARVVALESANAPKDFMAAKKLIAAATAVDRTRIADPDVSLREISA